jgi:hypothetical protein
MAFLANLTFEAAGKKRVVSRDPMAKAKAGIIAGILAQKSILSLVISGDPVARGARRWFYHSTKGDIRCAIKFGHDSIELKPGETEIVCRDYPHVLAVLGLVEQAVAAGELDEGISKMLETRPKRGRYAGRPSVTGVDAFDDDVDAPAEESEEEEQEPLKRMA